MFQPLTFFCQILMNKLWLLVLYVTVVVIVVGIFLLRRKRQVAPADDAANEPAAAVPANGAVRRRRAAGVAGPAQAAADLGDAKAQDGEAAAGENEGDAEGTLLLQMPELDYSIASIICQSGDRCLLTVDSPLRKRRQCTNSRRSR